MCPIDPADMEQEDSSKPILGMSHEGVGLGMRYSYWGYSIAAFLVWGVILVIFSIQGNATTTHNLLLVFLGWTIVWVSTLWQGSSTRHPHAGSTCGPDHGWRSLTRKGSDL